MSQVNYQISGAQGGTGCTNHIHLASILQSPDKILPVLQFLLKYSSTLINCFRLSDHILFNFWHTVDPNIWLILFKYLSNYEIFYPHKAIEALQELSQPGEDEGWICHLRWEGFWRPLLDPCHVANTIAEQELVRIQEQLLESSLLGPVCGRLEELPSLDAVYSPQGNPANLWLQKRHHRCM